VNILKILAISIIISTLLIGPIGLGSNQAFGAALSCSATLDGQQEVPPNGSTATGTASLQLNQAMNRLTISIQLVGLDLDGLQTPQTGNDDVVAAHIHRAPFGVNGPVVFGFISPNNDLNADLVINPGAGTIVSAWDTPEGQGTTLAAELANLQNNGLYINIHTVGVTSGEIRGQVICLPVSAVGGDMIPIDSTMVLLAGVQYSAAWMIPVIISSIGIGIVIARKF